MKKVVWWCIGGLLLLASTIANAMTDIDLSPYTKGTYLVNQGRYEQAAEQWHRLALAFLSAEAQLGRQKMWQYAGIAEALAAIAADKANDAVAYQYWADSTRYLMTGGTDWLQVRKKLHRRFEHANTLLSTQVHMVDVVSSVDLAWQQALSVLQVWDEKLSLFSFTSPRLGMHERLSTRPQAVAMPAVQPRYIRPAPSPTGKKLSGIKTGLSTENTSRGGMVPITGPDTMASDVDHDSASQQVKDGQKSVSVSPEVESARLRVNVSVSSGPEPVGELAGQPIPPVSQNVGNSKPTEIPNTDAKVIVSPVKPIQFRKEADLISGEIAHNVDEQARGVVSRGNLETVEDSGVEALRRRSFVPTTVSETPSSDE